MAEPSLACRLAFGSACEVACWLWREPEALLLLVPAAFLYALVWSMTAPAFALHLRLSRVFGSIARALFWSAVRISRCGMACQREAERRLRRAEMELQK